MTETLLFKTSNEDKFAKIKSVKIDFERDNILPGLNKEDLAELGKEDKPVRLKKGVLKRNLEYHKEVNKSDYNRIIGNALYDSDERFGGRSIHNPNYINFIKYGEKNSELVLVELAEKKDFYEIVHLFEPSNKKVQKMKPK